MLFDRSMFFAPSINARSSAQHIPTAAGLVGAIVFFVVGWLAARQALATFPEGTPATYFPLTIALIGAWQGWSVAGPGTGRGAGVAVANGVRCAVQIAFLGLLFFALRTMFLRAMDMRYDGFGEAIVAAMEQFVAYLLQSLTMPIWGVLLAGGVFGGLICEAAARRWR